MSIILVAVIAAIILGTTVGIPVAIKVRKNRVLISSKPLNKTGLKEKSLSFIQFRVVSCLALMMNTTFSISGL